MQLQTNGRSFVSGTECRHGRFRASGTFQRGGRTILRLAEEVPCEALLIQTSGRLSGELLRRIEVLRTIAFLMQEGLDPDATDQLIEIEKKKVISFVKKWIDDNDFSALTPEEIVHFLIERCSVIREPVSNRIDFIHRSFMEYLAANEAVWQPLGHEGVRAEDHDR